MPTPANTRLPLLLGKRKFLTAMTALVMSFILALEGTVDGSNWVAVTGLIVGLYAGSEAVEGFKGGS